MTEELIVGLHTDDLRCNHDKWVSTWTSHLEGSPLTVKVPLEASAISTPMNADNWRKMLADHPNRPLVEFFIAGITEWFRIGFNIYKMKL